MSPTGAASRPSMVRLTIGGASFTGRLEALAAPKSTAWLAGRLPLEGSLIHARWSGEAAWMPLDYQGRLAAENATAYPQPGQILLYAGEKSQPELLIPYGSCAFASRAGALAGNHIISLQGNLDGLRTQAEKLLQHGAQPLHLSWL